MTLTTNIFVLERYGVGWGEAGGELNLSEKLGSIRVLYQPNAQYQLRINS
jgi:hypothetical protein